MYGTEFVQTNDVPMYGTEFVQGSYEVFASEDERSEAERTTNEWSDSLWRCQGEVVFVELAFRLFSLLGVESVALYLRRLSSPFSLTLSGDKRC